MKSQPALINWVNVRVENDQNELKRSQDKPTQKQAQPTYQEFRVSKHEITFGQYQACVDEQVCSPIVFDGCHDLEKFGKLDIAQSFTLKEYQDMPVVCVNWYQANSFAKWVGARLPTQQHWRAMIAAEHPKQIPLELKEDPTLPQKFSLLYSRQCKVTKYRPYLGKGCDAIRYRSHCELTYYALTKVCSQKPERRVCGLIGSVDEWLYDLYYPLERSAEQCDQPTQPDLSRTSISCQRYIAMTPYRGDRSDRSESRRLRLDASPHRKSYTLGFRVVKDQD